MAKIVVISGAGISAESGLKTFRDDDGLWRSHSFYELASPQAWEKQPELVLEFYNERRQRALAAQPNPAHLALAELESHHDVVIVTQNVDDLHERAGSSQVIHLHGELAKVRSTSDSALIYSANGKPTQIGDLCELGSQLRPHIVWFGEMVMDFDIAIQEVSRADKVMVVGTSLAVYPAASLLDFAKQADEKILVTKDIDGEPPQSFQWLKGNAAQWVPKIVSRWLL